MVIVKKVNNKESQQMWAIEASPGTKAAYRGVVSFYYRLYYLLLFV